MEGELIIAQAGPAAPSPAPAVEAPGAPVVETPPLVETPAVEHAPEPLGAEAEAHSEVASDDHATVFPPFDATTFASQLLWLAITFAAFYLIMQRVALPRIGSILEVRRDRIASDLDRAAELKRQSDAAIAGYEKALSDARARAFSIAEESRKKASAEADELRKATEADLAAKLAAAERQIAGIRDRALGEVGTIAADVAETVVETLIGKAARSDVAAAVDDVMKVKA